MSILALLLPPPPVLTGVKLSNYALESKCSFITSPHL